MYLLHPEMDRTEAMIANICTGPTSEIPSKMEVSNCDTCQRKKQPNRNMVNY